MKFSDMCLALLIILLFVAMYVFSIVSVGLKKIKQKWPEYRCNPMVMPFASQFGFDPMLNFTQCIGNMQSDAMNFFLEPVHYLLSIMGGLGKELMDALNMIRRVIAFIRGMVGNIVGDIFGVFLNILIQVQTMMIKLKDMAMKIIGICVTILYVMGSSMKLGQSIWKGPIGGILRTLCFKDTTKIKLQQFDKLQNISDIHLGDILEDGAIVIGKLQLKGDKSNPYYRIWSDKLNDYIYVTGEHRILKKDNEGKELDDIFENYIKVSTCSYAEKTNEYDDVLHCLITSNHRIQVGEFSFWDWED
jgi:hypothetical protein